MNSKVNIYIAIQSESDIIGWWTFDKYGESYICDGASLEATNEYGDYERGTPCTSIKQAKAEAKLAVNMARYDGDPDPKATFWAYYKGKLVQIKFTRDDKIIIVNPKK